MWAAAPLHKKLPYRGSLYWVGMKKERAEQCARSSLGIVDPGKHKELTPTLR